MQCPKCSKASDLATYVEDGGGIAFVCPSCQRKYNRAEDGTLTQIKKATDVEEPLTTEAVEPAPTA
jgi:transposase-like protein